MSRKADKDTIVDNQRSFFAQIEEITNKTDEHLTLVIQEEIRKMNELVNINSKVTEKKIQKLYQDLDMDKVMKLLERKMPKEDAQEKFQETNHRSVINEKGIIKVYNQIEQLEVSRYLIKKYLFYSPSLKTWRQQ